jgi:hypothetical protein
MPWIRATPDEIEDAIASGDAIDVSWSNKRPRRAPRNNGPGRMMGRYTGSTRRTARRGYGNGGRAYDDFHGDDLMVDEEDGGFDGFYDRSGRRVNLVIQTPPDQLPPTRAANMFDETGRPYRTRSRF